MRRTTIAAAALGAALVGGGLAVTGATAWAGDDTTLRIVTDEASATATDRVQVGTTEGSTEGSTESSTGGWDCPEKDGTGGTQSPETPAETPATDTL